MVELRKRVAIKPTPTRMSSRGKQQQSEVAKSYRCPKKSCGATFSTKSALDRHVKVSHAPKAVASTNRRAPSQRVEVSKSESKSSRETASRTSSHKPGGARDRKRLTVERESTGTTAAATFERRKRMRTSSADTDDAEGPATGTSGRSASRRRNGGTPGLMSPPTNTSRSWDRNWHSLSAKLLQSQSKQGRQLRISATSYSLATGGVSASSASERAQVKERIVECWKAYDDWASGRTSTLLLPQTQLYHSADQYGAGSSHSSVHQPLSPGPGAAKQQPQSPPQRTSPRSKHQVERFSFKVATSAAPASGGKGGKAAGRIITLTADARSGAASAEYVSVDSLSELERNLKDIAIGGSAKAPAPGTKVVERNVLVKSFFPTRAAKPTPKRARGKRMKVTETASSPKANAQATGGGSGSEETPADTAFALNTLRRLTWFCESCACFHLLTSNMIMCPFSRRHGFRVIDVPADGDCFYYCVQNCLATDLSLVADNRHLVSVKEMRGWVAEACCADQFNFYQIQAIACPNDRHFDFIRPKGDIDAAQPSAGAPAEFSTQESAGSIGGACSDVATDRGAAGLMPAPGSPPQGLGDASAEEGSTSKFPLISTLLSHLPLMASMSQYMRRKTAHANATTAPSSSGAGGMEMATAGTVAELAANATGTRKRGRPRKSDESVTSSEALAPNAPGAAAPEAARSVSTSGGAAGVRSSSRVLAKATMAAAAATASAAVPKRSSRRGKGGLERGPKVTSLAGLREYIRREGSVVGASESMWADNFAFMVIGNRLKLTILLIDMERRKGCLPYRYLHKYERQAGDRDEDCRFIVLKRTGPAGHFQYVQQLPPGHARMYRASHGGHASSLPSPTEQLMSPAASSVSAGATPPFSAEAETPGGTNSRSCAGDQTPNSGAGGTGLACFTRSQLPDVFVSLWDIPPV